MVPATIQTLVTLPPADMNRRVSAVRLSELVTAGILLELCQQVTGARRRILVT
jgi:hypothetical protein